MAAPSANQVRATLAAVVAMAAVSVAGFEGLRNDPYDDVRGIRTVCYGETSGVVERHYSDAECTAKLQKSLEKHASEVLKCLPPDAPVPTLAAFASLAYNVGSPAVCGSTAARKLRAGDSRGACDQFLLWNKIRKNGQYVVSRGLSNRRATERALCERGLK